MSEKYLAQFRQGSGAMAQNAIDYYINENGQIVKHSWAMGGSDKKVVKNVPNEINGYKKIL